MYAAIALPCWLLLMPSGALLYGELNLLRLLSFWQISSGACIKGGNAISRMSAIGMKWRVANLQLVLMDSCRDSRGWVSSSGWQMR